MTTMPANTSETTLADAMATTNATAGYPPSVRQVPMPANAPTSINPSAVRLRTPERSEMISPNAASAYGTAFVGALASQLIRNVVTAAPYRIQRIRWRTKNSDDATDITMMASIS